MALDVVGGVDDDDEPGPEVRLEAVRQLGPADAAGEQDDRAAHSVPSSFRAGDSNQTAKVSFGRNARTTFSSSRAVAFRPAAWCVNAPEPAAR